MHWQTFKSRLSESAISVALDAFWFAVWGAVLTAATAIILFIRGASLPVLTGLMGAAIAFGVVLLATAIIVIRRRVRSGGGVVTGTKGFMDYKIQGSRAANKMAAHIVSFTKQVNGMTKASVAFTKSAQKDSAWAKQR